jgi:hypothetical protein
LFVYYEGHGAYDPNAPANDKTMGHFLALSDRRLPRGELVARMEGKNPRLSVLLTDCCNVSATMRVRRRFVPELRTFEVIGWTGLEDLLFSYRGVVDGTASSRDEYSWFSNDVGGWFTTSFIDKCGSIVSQRSVDWKTTWDQLTQETEAFFQAQKAKFKGQDPELDNQAHMLPHDFRLDVVRQEAADRPTETKEFMVPVGKFIDP